MFYTVYKITNKLSGKTYIGSHKTKKLDDGYMGSGKYLKRSIEKNGLENFEKQVLHVYDNPEAMFAKEAELVNEDYLSEGNTYNLKIGGEGGFDYLNSINPSSKKLDSWRGKNLTEEHKHKISVSNKGKNVGNKNAVGNKTWYGKKHSKETIEKMSLSKKGKTTWNKGVPRSEETKRKISESLKRKSLLKALGVEKK